MTIFVVLIMASVSGAVAAQFTAAEPMPDGLGQPDTWNPDPSPLAFDSP